ncbi:TetR/AcrR family transcriptional regulator [Microbacterium sp. NPDC056569]|uniref:TetR/AcrR family transcriptional regulator n=1 Tax=Microbacterium sp. NPDC056569 TaxID=3345867 RepID=UPI00366FA0E8
MAARIGATPEKTGAKRLDRPTIISAGLELAEATGAASLSIRDLGAKLGTDPTAIYRHFRSKDDLMRALLDELAVRSLREVTAPPEDWRERLRQLANATLTQFAQYPAVGQEGIVLTTRGPGELDVIELMLDAFSRAGLTGDDLVQHYALMATHVLSTAAGVARSRTERAAAGAAGSTPWFEGPLLVDPIKHPHVAAISAQLLALEDRELFALGVESVIRSAERVAHSA